MPFSQDNLKIYCPTVRPDFYEELRTSVAPVNVVAVDGSNANSFSQLCNQIITSAPEEFIIIANDKARPTAKDFERMLELFEVGFGFVGLYRMGFFGANRSIFKKVGLLDERFTDGGYEDNDYYLRLKLHDVAAYITEEIEYRKSITTLWPQKESAVFFEKKYTFANSSKIIYKHIDDEACQTTMECSATEFYYKPWQESVLRSIPLVSYEAHFEQTLRDYKIIDKSERSASSDGLPFFRKLARLFRS